jgi:cytochrome c
MIDKDIKMKRLALILTMSFCFSATAHAGDPVAGEKVFKKCKVCHVVDKEKNKTGPHLVGLLGRTAGSVDSFTQYSKAMKASGIVWNVETLDGYLANPKTYLKGTKMAFAGLRKEKDRQNIIAYFESLQ